MASGKNSIISSGIPARVISSIEYSIMEFSEKDIGEVEKYFEENNFILKDKKLLEWKYLRNPGGKARIFVMRNEKGKIQGILSYLPRIYRKSNLERINVVQAVDALIAPEARGKALYPKIIKHSTKEMKIPIYGFPNKRAEQIEVRSGWEILSPIDSWFFPVKIGDITFMKNILLARGIMNFFSKIYMKHMLARKGKIEIRGIEEFGAEHGMVESGLSIERNAAFLNWRYIQNPFKKYTCLEFRKLGKIIGYCVFFIDVNKADIYEFAACQNQKECMRAAIEYFWEKKLRYAIFKTAGMNFKIFGFMKRKTVNNIISCEFPKIHLAFSMGDSDWD